MSIQVTVAHLRKANLCSRGARQWFDRHGLDYAEFLKNGYPIERVDEINDALARLVAQTARDDAEEEAA